VVGSYTCGEDLMLCWPVVAVVQRDLLNPEFVTAWFQAILHPQGRPAWTEAWLDEDHTRLHHNTRHFTRSLLFQLQALTHPTQSARALLSAVTAALRLLHVPD
jgi:hypothetical protein